MFRSRNWFGGGFWKSRNPHSLEHLKYLYNILSKNQTVSDNNRGLLIETLRSIAEILIWGDQNDSSVFDFFLEKNMLSFFLRIMIQKCGSYVCVQLLQTLNILFENIRNETSLYYLLSNNHVNSIIVHKFDFSDEEVMAYYISFLKTLSFKLNAHTIHFFYNEHTNDFPLYTEAIKFFNHSEGMVRIAVRTLTLNVYRVKDVSMLKFIRDRTAAPYFSNLVWFIGNHIIELDICVRNDADHQNQNRLSDLLAEHLDHLHYLNDILCLNIEDLNMVLSEHLLHKLFFPLYLYSLIRPTDSVCDQQGGRKSISTVVALFLLSQIFLIISYEPLVRTLASVLLKHNIDIKSASCRNSVEIKDVVSKEVFNFIPPKETLEKSLENLSELKENCMMTVQDEKKYKEAENSQTIDYLLSSAGALNKKEESLEVMKKTEVNVPIKTEIHREINNSNKTVASEAIEDIKHLSVTDEEKEQRLALENPLSLSITYATSEKELFNESFLKRIFTSMHCTENDYAALFALCLLYALLNNQGIHSEALTTFLLSVEVSLRSRYKETLIDRIVHIITLSCHTNAKIRLVTLELAIKLLIQLVIPENNVFIQDYHLEALETVKELSTMLLRNFFKSEDIFLDMFEDEYAHIQKKTLKVEWLMMDSNILLPPTGTPMTGIEFSKRLPCGEVERVRRAIRIFFLIRKLSLLLNNKVETQLPLTNSNSDIQVNNVLDLNNSDLIACTVISKDEQRIRRFLVIDCTQLILVEPDTRKLGWGVAKFVGFLQDIEVISDKEDSRSLNLMIRKPLHNTINKKTSLFSAKLIFDDHIRCMAAKQRLTKGRIKTRQRKISQIATLLCISTTTPHCSNTPSSTWFSFREDTRGFCLVTERWENIVYIFEQQSIEAGLNWFPGHKAPPSRVDKNQKLKDQKRMFTINKVPGFATQTKYEILNIPSFGFIGPNFKPMDFILNDSKSHDLNIEFQDTSPKVSRGLNEEIPLENMQLCESSRVISSIEQGKSAGMQKKRSIDTKPKNSSEETSFTEKHTDNSRARNKGKVETV